MTDTNAHMLSWGVLDYGLVVDGAGYSEAIKGSNLVGAGAVDFVASGGSEDVIDCVRGSGYRFEDGRLVGNGCRTFITLKGGIDGVVLKDLILSGEPRYWWDISIGDHTIYNKGKLMNTRGVVLDNVVKADGRRVKVFVLDGEKPELGAGKYWVIRVPKVLAWLWMKIKG